MSRIAPYVAIALLFAVAGAFFMGQIRGKGIERTKWEATIEQARADAADAVRKIERAQQEKVNDVLRKQNANLAGINADLARDLAELRNRPERPMPDGAGTACEGAAGSDLSRRDAEFLVGFAARADRIRAALGACYAAYDAVRRGE